MCELSYFSVTFSSRIARTRYEIQRIGVGTHVAQQADATETTISELALLNPHDILVFPLLLCMKAYLRPAFFMAMHYHPRCSHFCRTRDTYVRRQSRVWLQTTNGGIYPVEPAEGSRLHTEIATNARNAQTRLLNPGIPDFSVSCCRTYHLSTQL